MTTEGFTGIVLFGEKNGCFNASFTKMSSKGKAAFLQVCIRCSQKSKEDAGNGRSSCRQPSEPTRTLEVIREKARTIQSY